MSCGLAGEARLALCEMALRCYDEGHPTEARALYALLPDEPLPSQTEPSSTTAPPDVPDGSPRPKQLVYTGLHATYGQWLCGAGAVSAIPANSLAGGARVGEKRSRGAALLSKAQLGADHGGSSSGEGTGGGEGLIGLDPGLLRRVLARALDIEEYAMVAAGLPQEMEAGEGEGEARGEVLAGALDPIWPVVGQVSKLLYVHIW